MECMTFRGGDKRGTWHPAFLQKNKQAATGNQVVKTIQHYFVSGTVFQKDMLMKKIALAISALVIFTPVVFAASTGTITFNGELTATTCKVSIDGQGADALVKLPTIGTNQLGTPGAVAGSTAFSMALSDCAGTLKSASAYFEANGSDIDLTNGRLNNNGGTAKLVQLQLRDGSSAAQAVINAGSPEQISAMTYVDTSTGTATLPYLVEYYAQGQTEPGTVVSKVVYSIQYK